MATALSNLLALLALDNSAYLEGLAGSQAAADDFGTKLSNVGGAVVLGGLTAAATAVVAIGGAAFDAAEQVDEAFDKIAVGTGATGDQLAILQDDFKAVFASVPADANTAAEAITILASRLDVSGEALQNIATPMLEVTRILGGDLRLADRGGHLGDAGVVDVDVELVDPRADRVALQSGPAAHIRGHLDPFRLLRDQVV